MSRTSEFPAGPNLVAGFISLSCEDAIDAYDDMITLNREYTHPDASFEDTYTVYRGGPGFGVFEKALNGQITMEQAARWWDQYRDDFAVLTYRALFAVEEHTDASTEPLTRQRLGDLLSWEAGVDPIRQAAAIEYAIRDKLMQERGGGLMLAAQGEDTLHAAPQPDTLGEDDRDIFGPPWPQPVTAAAMAAASFAAGTGNTGTTPLPEADQHAGAQHLRQGWSRGR